MFNALLDIEEVGNVEEKNLISLAAGGNRLNEIEQKKGVPNSAIEDIHTERTDTLNADMETKMGEEKVVPTLEGHPETSQDTVVRIQLSSRCWGDETEKDEMDEEEAADSPAQIEEDSTMKDLNLHTAVEMEEASTHQIDLNRDIIRRSQKEILTDVVDIGHEVLFAGSPFSSHWAGRTPKKKGHQPEAQSSRQAGKRRVLGSLDFNGLRQSERQDSDSSMEDDRRLERKMRDEDMISNMADSNSKRKAKPNKAKAIRSWIQKQKGDFQAIALQEVKVDSWGARRWLKGVLKDGTLIYDKPVGSKGGTALLLSKGMQVLASGTGGRGRLAWAKVRWGSKVFGLMSIYAPNKRNLRINFWDMMKGMLGEDPWVIIGDFNNVEIPEDTRGKSALVTGSEARQWRSLSVDKGLVDSFFVQHNKHDPDTPGLLKDVTEWIVLVLIGPMCHKLEKEEGRRKTESYFKMCHLDLKNPEVLRKIRDVWKEELESVRDERRRWARGWTRVKSVLKEARKDRDKKKREEGALAEELAWRRDNLTNDLTAAEVDTLAVLEKRAKEQDLHEAKIWRIRSRERWLSVDEAPTRYFFTKLCAKWAQEAVEALEVNGDEVTDHEDILSKIHKFYAELFQAEVETEERRVAREEVVGLITKRLSPEDSNHLSRMPDKEEIEGVVFKMKTDKAPEADGLTIEVLKICWEWLGEDCISGEENSDELRVIEVAARQNKYRILRDICGDGGKISPAALNNFWPNPQGADGDTNEIREWLSRIQIEECSLTQIPDWFWSGPNQAITGWTHSAKFWTELQWQMKKSYKGISQRWEEPLNPENWNRRWQELWNGPIPFREKIWFWRLLNLGVITGDWAAKWKVADGCLADAKEMIKLTMASANVVISKLSGRNAMSTEGAIRDFLDKAEVELSKAKERQAQVRVILDEIDGWDSGSETIGLLPSIESRDTQISFSQNSSDEEESSDSRSEEISQEE
ncbi:hypothetical protein R1sor_013099 [Riccia sorocarpa]|uniref:Endonuclease/exonuclease/phosphatase domain-containing protein n=1 Tax=Riccia sorocarpa TaxID=122646 RepID=A0ABD3H5J1_9MARC